MVRQTEQQKLRFESDEMNERSLLVIVHMKEKLRRLNQNLKMHQKSLMAAVHTIVVRSSLPSFYKHRSPKAFSFPCHMITIVNGPPIVK